MSVVVVKLEGSLSCFLHVELLSKGARRRLGHPRAKQRSNGFLPEQPTRGRLRNACKQPLTPYFVLVDRGARGKGAAA